MGLHPSMSSATKHNWTFSTRFRRHAFGWRSQTAIKRIKEAVSEIKKTARKDAVRGAEGAVLFLEKVSPAIEQVDSSSGAVGTAVDMAIEALVTVIADAPASEQQRDGWLNRLWRAVEADGIPYIELLADHWGTLCVTSERASHWAEEFKDAVRMAWSPKPRGEFANCWAVKIEPIGSSPEFWGTSDRDKKTDVGGPGQGAGGRLKRGGGDLLRWTNRSSQPKARAGSPWKAAERIFSGSSIGRFNRMRLT